MFEVQIDVYKDSGKWYTGDTVTSEKDILMYKDEFKEFIKNNCPADIREGFIVVRDTLKSVENNCGFHTHLYRYHEIFGVK